MPSSNLWESSPMMEYGRIRPFGSLRRTKQPGSISSPASPTFSNLKEVILLVWGFFSTSVNSRQVSGSFFLPRSFAFSISLLNASLHSFPNSSIFCSYKLLGKDRIHNLHDFETLTSINFSIFSLSRCKYS